MENLYIKFNYEAIENRSKTLQEGRSIYDRIEYYRLHLPGGNDIREGEVNDSIRDRFKTPYQNWIQKEALKTKAESGTPLIYWPLIGVNLLKECEFLNIFTVEALANLKFDTKEHSALKTCKAKAQTWLSLANDLGKQVEAFIKIKQENQKLEQELNALKKLTIKN